MVVPYLVQDDWLVCCFKYVYVLLNLSIGHDLYHGIRILRTSRLRVCNKYLA